MPNASTRAIATNEKEAVNLKKSKKEYIGGGVVGSGRNVNNTSKQQKSNKRDLVCKVSRVESELKKRQLTSLHTRG